MISELVYTRKGSGEPLVLIHGIGHRRQAWDPIFDRLAETYDVIAVDLAGFGESPAYPVGTKYSSEVACHNLQANFEHWGIKRPHVVGNSLGGAISLELANRGLVSSVTALSPAGFFGRLNLLQAIFHLFVLRLSALFTPMPLLRKVLAVPALRNAMMSSLFAHPERLDEDAIVGDSLALRHARAFERTALANLGYHFTGMVPVPTTIAWGTRDKILPYSQAGTAVERLPHALHVPLPGSGHVPMVDDPDAIIELIHATVDRATGRDHLARPA
ncbi:hydrolase, alpha/beta domain protein [Aeromicrobium marinum DSM 15272]|uniref:Hydrolase, alpha/beta domain protein n=1 Tax=Aeromicrobium marinum DSM 15272 TaxID=585531 RepID=E2S8H7_9ACTN|nr:alpha/beta fold hydrolase [Aeromicrobium marinum]EFQ84482.1 hydrolase, alpha/beta domain protein [Aeromicrobium marinum DSM 15272]